VVRNIGTDWFTGGCRIFWTRAITSIYWIWVQVQGFTTSAPFAPGLQEITRRVNLHGIWQAAYTAGVVLPRPVAACRYWHRSLNPKKLIDVHFSSLAVSVGFSMQCLNTASLPACKIVKAYLLARC
jgi:hypothetical protein